jgi:hypothetical protein
MEVHHHSHPSTGSGNRKKWTHYFWEFFMLFLAVTLGFFVENQREHYIENKRERKYVDAIVNDLAADTSWVNMYTHNQRVAVYAFDSVILLLRQNKKDEFSLGRLYYLVRMAIRLSSANKANDNAYDQMRSSGNLRLLRKQAIVDSISNYYFNLKEIDLINNPLLQRQQAMVEFEGKLFDGNVFHQMTDINSFEFSVPESGTPLITEDKAVINDFITRVHYLISVMLYSENFAKQQKAKAISLIEFLKKEYHLE